MDKHGQGVKQGAVTDRGKRLWRQGETRPASTPQKHASSSPCCRPRAQSVPTLLKSTPQLITLCYWNNFWLMYTIACMCMCTHILALFPQANLENHCSVDLGFQRRSLKLPSRKLHVQEQVNKANRHRPR